jgi:DNA-binding transcriptional regulator YhcF (GntR family)
MVDDSKMPAPGSPQTELTTLAVDRDAEVPIGVQLAWALRTRIADGEFKPGQRLPGLRDMAEAIGVNLNTVRTVYQRLEHEGLIESQQGSGTFVAPTSALGSAVGTIAASAARAARETGVDPREVAAALYVAPQPPPLSIEEAADLSEVDRRRALRTQIATLERTVAELEAEHPGIAPVSVGSRRGVGPTLLTADELAQVRAVLIRRLTVVQAAIDERVEERRRSSTSANDAKSRARQSKREPGKAKAQKPTPSVPARRARATPRPAPASG